MDELQIRDPQADRRRFVVRALLCAVVATALLFMLVGRVFTLQVVNHEHYVTQADGNRVRVEPIPPTRGLIQDRHGEILARNVPTYQLEIIPEQVVDVNATLDGLDEIIDLDERERERFFELMQTQRPFQPVPVRQRLTEEDIAHFAVERHNFPGVEIQARLARDYPQGEAAAHIIGYLGAISREDLPRVDERRYRGTSHIGKTGIEFSYEPILHGSSGSRRVETNAQGRVIRTLDIREPALPGSDLVLSVDMDLQRIAHDQLEGERGAVVALDVRDGSVLAMASRPSFDPNRLAEGMATLELEQLQDDPARPLFNRALRGTYPPGSTVKPFLGTAAISTRNIEPDDEIFCDGEYHIEGWERAFRDWRREGHGPTDYHRAVVESCDIYFYKMAEEMGIEGIHGFLSAFGLGQQAGIDIPWESEGVVPSREWKQRELGESWFRGETVIAGIGQGYMLSTPIQLARATATLANRGQARQPRLLKGIRDRFQDEHQTLPAPAPTQAEFPTPMPESAWMRTFESMVDSVHSPRGTAQNIGFGHPLGDTYRIAGKTGTSQVFQLGEDEEYEHEELAYHLRDHALFIAFAPAENPEIAVAVVVEHGGGGGGVAAPKARAVLDAHLLGQDPSEAESPEAP